MSILRIICILLVYPIAVIMLTWPLTTSLSHSVIGILHVDFIDTVALRFSDQAIGFWPTPYPFSTLQPNRLDFYTFLPFRALGFPRSDNLWWMTMIAINGWCAHFMGQSIRGSTKDGFICGLFLLSCETTLREATLHHAPQIMFMGMPLFIGFWLRILQNDSTFNRLGACFAFVLTSLSYWFYGLFLLLAMIPFFWTPKRKALLSILSIGTLCLLPFVYLLIQTPMAEITRPKIPYNPWFFLSTPADKSGRIPILLIIAFGIHFRTIKHTYLIVWTAVISVIAMTCSLNAPLDASLPFLGHIQENIPILSRLHWPERWSILLHLGCALTIIQIPWKWVPFIIMESVLFSSNAPIPTTPTQSISCFSQLSAIRGNILMWPWDKPEINLPAVYRRLHNKKVLNPFVLPRGHALPDEWTSFQKEAIPTKDFLVQENIEAIFIDTSPWSSLSKGEQNTLRYKISKNLGPSTSIGCAEVWSREKMDWSIETYEETELPDTSSYSIEPFWIP